MAESAISIRIAMPQEAPLIADMSRQTFYESFASQNTNENMDKFMKGPFSREKLIDETVEPGNIFLLAFLGNEPVGYCKISDLNEPIEQGEKSSIEIARIYVVQDKIGCGIGKALMHNCIAIGKGKGKRGIWLGVWEHNVRAIKFYTQWGF